MTLDDYGVDVKRILDNDTEYCDDIRYRCRTDHLFLSPFLGYTLFTETIHRPVANLYVQKKPGLTWEEQDEIKQMMHLDPRETFKTTFGIVDSTQWIIYDPNITILNESATQPLAKAITDAISAKFWVKREGNPTLFQRLFAEYCVIKQPESGVFIAPNRTTEDIDATVDSTSVKTAQAGWHPIVFNPDDAVETTNSGIGVDPKVRQKVIDNHNTNVNALRRGGYLHFRGTRYHPFELYGETLRKMDRSRWRVLIRSVLRVKSGKRLVEGDFPPESDVEILFPELITYAQMREKFYAGYESFMCQQMNDPQGGAVAVFTEEAYKQSTDQAYLIPSMGEVFIAWRLPYEGKEYMRKYAEGVAVRILGNKLFIIGAWQGSFAPDELAEKIVTTARKYHCGEVTIERTPGSDYIIPHIENEMLSRNWNFRIVRPDFEPNDFERSTRCKQLQPLMKNGRLRISNSVGNDEALKTQFVDFGLIQENGLIDCVSRLAKKAPSSIANREISDEQKELQRFATSESNWNFIFGQDGGAQVMQETLATEAVAPAARKNSYGLRSILGGLDG